jgi:hypothetical protein
VAPCASRSIGTTSGDWSTIRTSPSTTCVSFENADMLSLVRALAIALRVPFTARGLNCVAYFSSTVSTSKREYQTSRLPMPAKPAMECR